MLTDPLASVNQRVSSSYDEVAETALDDKGTETALDDKATKSTKPLSVLSCMPLLLHNRILHSQWPPRVDTTPIRYRRREALFVFTPTLPAMYLTSLTLSLRPQTWVLQPLLLLSFTFLPFMFVFVFAFVAFMVSGAFWDLQSPFSIGDGEGDDGGGSGGGADGREFTHSSHSSSSFSKVSP